jgi:glycerol-3-phosphate dehydrogenase
MDYDLIVIGAGIQGAGVAQAASAQGYRVLVIEQYQEAGTGTSSRSSKLIHGGLRYLETGQFSLVYECLQERKRLLKNAPHLVKLVPFYIPVYKNSYRKPWMIALGLALYSLLSFKPFQRIPKSQWASLNGLSTQGLKAVFKYYDGQTDDKKLTQAVLSSTKSLGADLMFSTKVEAIKIEPKSCSVAVSNSGERKILSSLAVVNAAGPWVESVLEKSAPIVSSQPKVDLVQGTHIIIPRKTKLLGMYYLEAPQDQRAVFVMPWKGQLLIGTTEVDYYGDPANVEPLETEIQYLLTVYNHYFSDNVSQADVSSAFAGLRVLPQSDGAAFSRPRDTLLIGDNGEQSRMFSLYGGKLTAYRATAEKVMRRLRGVLPSTKRTGVDTRELLLP